MVDNKTLPEVPKDTFELALQALHTRPRKGLCSSFCEALGLNFTRDLENALPDLQDYKPETTFDRLFWWEPTEKVERERVIRAMYNKRFNPNSNGNNQ